MAGTNKHYVTGYPSHAAFIASDRDKTTLIFRRFDRLAARTLLHLQSELAELEAELDRLDDEDSSKDLQTKQCLRNWKEFQATASVNPAQKEKSRLIYKIKSVMKEYREALFFESTLATLPHPNRKTLEAFRLKFFNGPAEELGSFPTLGGASATILEDYDDLVELKTAEHPDRLTQFAQDHLSFLFQTRPRDGQIAYTSDLHIYRFVAWLSALLAAVELIGAIILLYVVKSPNCRLGLIAMFTALFAVTVGLLTNARRAELFAATAAYAAVLVVFVSGNLGQSPSQ